LTGRAFKREREREGELQTAIYIGFYGCVCVCELIMHVHVYVCLSDLVGKLKKIIIKKSMKSVEYGRANEGGKRSRT